LPTRHYIKKMPPKFAKIEAFNYGLKLGQIEVILTVLVQKVSSKEELSKRAKELEPRLEMLKMMFQAKSLKRTANFSEEIQKLDDIDEELNQLLDEMKELDIPFFDQL
jgi:hypothetical protein